MHIDCAPTYVFATFFSQILIIDQYFCERESGISDDDIHNVYTPVENSKINALCTLP